MAHTIETEAVLAIRAERRPVPALERQNVSWHRALMPAFRRSRGAVWNAGTAGTRTPRPFPLRGPRHDHLSDDARPRKRRPTLSRLGQFWDAFWDSKKKGVSKACARFWRCPSECMCAQQLDCHHRSPDARAAGSPPRRVMLPQDQRDIAARACYRHRPFDGTDRGRRERPSPPERRRTARLAAPHPK
jgi:hypothetical protein